AGSELTSPRAALVDLLTELCSRIETLPYPILFPIEVRVAAADDIWLSTAYQRDSAYIAIHQYVGMPYQEYFEAFWSIVDGVGGRPHWGKMHALGAEQLRERYPRFDDFLRLRSTVDPEGVFGNAHLDQILGPVSKS